jgi:predicted dehydrogenase
LIFNSAAAIFIRSHLAYLNSLQATPMINSPPKPTAESLNKSIAAKSQLKSIVKAVLSVMTILFVLAAGRMRADEPIRVGIIGIDTSHAPAFTRAMNDPKDNPRLSGCKVLVAYPQGSADIPTSVAAGEKNRQVMLDAGVELIESIDEMLTRVDAVLLESNDGRPHLAQAIPCLRAKKTLFIDKPFAGSLADAIAIYRLAEQLNVPVFSSSALRYSKGAKEIVAGSLGEVRGCDAYSPCPLQPNHPDLFWYGIHGVETLYTAMGPGCERVTRVHTDNVDLVVGTWGDGRVGTFRGIRARSGEHGGGYGGQVFGSKGIGQMGDFSGYEPLVEEIVQFFKTKTSPVPASTTLEIYCFMEAADASLKQDGKQISLSEFMQQAELAATERIKELAPDLAR